MVNLKLSKQLKRLHLILALFTPKSADFTVALGVHLRLAILQQVFLLLQVWLLSFVLLFVLQLAGTLTYFFNGDLCASFRLCVVVLDFCQMKSSDFFFFRKNLLKSLSMNDDCDAFYFFYRGLYAHVYGDLYLDDEST